LASGSEDKKIKLWSVESQKEVTTFKGHRGNIYSVAFSPDGKYLASGSWDNTVKLWSVELQKEANKLAHKHNNRTICSIAFSPDRKYLAFGCYYMNI
jgi:WD40 repeat protein